MLERYGLEMEYYAGRKFAGVNSNHEMLNTKCND
jgi:hypothetical protein